MFRIALICQAEECPRSYLACLRCFDSTFEKNFKEPLEFNKSKPGIKFAAGDQLVFFSTLRQRVDDYFESNHISSRANASMVFKTIILLICYLLPLIMITIFQLPFWLSLIMWFVIGLALAGMGMSVMHDANHGAYSENETVNRWMSYSLNLLGGGVFNWRMQHNVLHHTYTNIAGLDEDIDAKLILRFSPHSEVRKVHKRQWAYAFILYSILTLYWALFKDFVQFMQYKKSGLNKKSASENTIWFIKMTVIKCAYFFFMLVLPTLMGNPFGQVLTGFLLMNFVAGMILSVVFQLAHTVEETTFPLPDENGQMENSWAVHQLSTTMDFARHNKFLSWYVGGLNFQVEHHLFTKICHVHYPAISEIVKKTTNEYGVPYLEKPTLIEAFRSHVKHLKKCGAPTLDEIGG